LWKNEKILIILTFTLIFAIAAISFGIAYTGGVRGIEVLGVCFFFTGGVIVVLAQLIRAGIFLSFSLGTGFSSIRKGEMPTRTT
jgi:hypothetical protein